MITGPGKRPPLRGGVSMAATFGDSSDMPHPLFEANDRTNGWVARNGPANRGS